MTEEETEVTEEETHPDEGDDASGASGWGSAWRERDRPVRPTTLPSEVWVWAVCGPWSDPGLTLVWAWSDPGLGLV